jgi:hypothetical protein
VRYLLPVLVAAALAAVAIGLSHPAQQTCAEVKAIRAGAGSDEVVTKKARSRLEALLTGSAPACAIRELAGSGPGALRSSNDVPEQLSGLDAARAWVTNLGLGTTEWVLLLAAGLLLLRTALAIVISRRPGGVDLDTVTDAASEKPDATVAAQLHQRLADQHLFGTPLVPGGGLPEAVATTVKETELANTGWLASLIRSLPNLLPKAGVKLDVVIRGRESGKSPSGCTATLTDMANGEVMAVLTGRGNTALDAADAVAASAMTHILDRRPIRRRTPAWSRFGVRSKVALAELTQGNDLLSKYRAGDAGADVALRRAQESYAKALDNDPANLTIALKLGNTQELRTQTSNTEPAKQRVAATMTYLRARELWPEALASRYRAAIALAACADNWDAGRDECELTALGLDSAASCRDAAKSLLEDLVDDLSWWRVTRRWLKTFYRSRERKAGTRKYFQRFINPLSINRRRVRATYSMSVLITAESCRPNPVERERAVKRLLCEGSPYSYTPFDRFAVNWQVRYNAACYYARRASKDREHRRSCLENANRLLLAVLSDPSHEITGSWLCNDPDLESLHGWPGFHWEQLNVLGGISAAEPTSTARASGNSSVGVAAAIQPPQPASTSARPG